MKSPLHILKLIEQNQIRCDPVLDLRGHGLLEVPPEIRGLNHLKRLLLGDNALQRLPSWLADFPQMCFIQLNMNPLHEVADVPNLVLDWGVWWRLRPRSEYIAGLWLRWEPGEMLEAALALPNLHWLDLSEQRLRSLPPRVFSLTNLIRLDVSYNRLKELPQDIARLSNLRELNVSANPIQQIQTRFEPLLDNTSHIPSTYWLNHLKKSNPGGELLHATLEEDDESLKLLTGLDASRNRLKEVPSRIKKCSQLTRLVLARNQITHLPDWIGNLKFLSRLDIEDNRINTLPPALIKLHDLRELKVKYHWRDETNFLQSPYLEALDLDENGYADITKLRAYFRQAEHAGLDALYEAKLLILGDGEAGKTSLARKILDRQATLPEKEDSTRGIDITHWEFPVTRAGKHPRPHESAKNFRVNLWDFGGQQIYHATHQFFLTKRSLYVLVAESRREGTDFYGWLNRVELFGDHAPVFIVKNRKFGRPVEFDEAALRERFPNLHNESFDCDLKTGEGLDAVLDFIRFRIQQLPHVGQELPKTWLRVREILEADNRPYLGLEEYLGLCAQHGFEHRADGLQLSEYLHDLGVILHFQDDELLKKVVILDPAWGTDAVYQVLDSERIQNGRFSQADLREIWRADRYQDMRAELLSLMRQFQLCYELPEPGHFIVPRLLSRKKPDYPWDDHGNLQLRYHYPRFMPGGIVTRFIVAVHHLIEDRRERVWQTGVVVQENETRAEIREDAERREIRLRLSGDHPRDLLAYLVGELEKIHRSLHGLEYQRLIPCNCDGCATAQEPHFYPFEVLKRFQRDGRTAIQCHISYQMVEVQGLLEGVGEKPEPPLLSREEIYDRLVGFNLAHFAEIEFKFGLPEKLRLPEKPLVEQVTNLIVYAEGLERLADLAILLERVVPMKTDTMDHDPTD